MSINIYVQMIQIGLLVILKFFIIYYIIYDN